MKMIRYRNQGSVLMLGVVSKSMPIDLFDDELNENQSHLVTATVDMIDGMVHLNKSVPRGTIDEFSVGSRRRMLSYLCATKVKYSAMATLTLPTWLDVNGNEFKSQLDTMLRWMLVNTSTNDGNPASIFWFLEFTGQGVPHVHALVNGFIYKHLLANEWARLWAFRDGIPVEVEARSEAMKVYHKLMAASTRIEALRGGATVYAAKYSVKNEQKIVPEGYTHVGRFWGVRGFRELHDAHTYEVALWDTATDDLVNFWIGIDKIALNHSSSVTIKPWSQGAGLCIYRKKETETEGFQTVCLSILQLLHRLPRSY